MLTNPDYASLPPGYACFATAVVAKLCERVGRNSVAYSANFLTKRASILLPTIPSSRAHLGYACCRQSCANVPSPRLLATRGFAQFSRR